MIDFDISELRAVLAAAKSEAGLKISDWTYQEGRDWAQIIADGVPYGCARRQGRLIVAAVNSLPFLLDKIEAQESEIHDLRTRVVELLEDAGKLTWSSK